MVPTDGDGKQKRVNENSDTGQKSLIHIAANKHQQFQCVVKEFYFVPIKVNAKLYLLEYMF